MSELAGTYRWKPDGMIKFAVVFYGSPSFFFRRPIKKSTYMLCLLERSVVFHDIAAGIEPFSLLITYLTGLCFKTGNAFLRD